jgi:hypothetical protein
MCEERRNFRREGRVFQRERMEGQSGVGDETEEGGGIAGGKREDEGGEACG